MNTATFTATTVKSQHTRGKDTFKSDKDRRKKGKHRLTIEIKAEMAEHMGAHLIIL